MLTADDRWFIFRILMLVVSCLTCGNEDHFRRRGEQLVRDECAEQKG